MLYEKGVYLNRSFDELCLSAPRLVSTVEEIVTKRLLEGQLDHDAVDRRVLVESPDEGRQLLLGGLLKVVEPDLHPDLLGPPGRETINGVTVAAWLMDTQDIYNVGFESILANTYHLMLQKPKENMPVNQLFHV